MLCKWEECASAKRLDPGTSLRVHWNNTTFLLCSEQTAFLKSTIVYECLRCMVGIKAFACFVFITPLAMKADVVFSWLVRR